MIYIELIFIIFQLIGRCASKNDTIKELLAIKNKIEIERAELKNQLEHLSPAYQFIRGEWNEYIGDMPVLVHNRVGHWSEVGNYLGIYLDAIACADVARMHYLAVNTYWLKEDYSQVDQAAPFDEFLNLLPSTIVHRQPQVPLKPLHLKSHLTNRVEAVAAIEKECKCEFFCWEKTDAAWVKRVDYIRDVFLNTLTNYLSGPGVPPSHLTLVHGIDMASVDIEMAATRDLLPLVPEVTIQYRCSDTLRSDRYGFLPFRALLKIIPSSTSSIYVTSEHPQRNYDSELFVDECGFILKSLFEFLQIHYPTTVVVIKRGSDLFHDMARFAFSKITICSASTFCLWPGIASNGTVYFPVSAVVLEGLEAGPVDLGSRFHWIDDPDAHLEHFVANEKVEQIIRILNKSNYWVQTLPHSPTLLEKSPTNQQKKINTHSSSSSSSSSSLSNTTFSATFSHCKTRVWPSIELMLPLSIRSRDGRTYEWIDVFLRSFLFFWPRSSHTTLTLLLDAEAKTENSNDFEEFTQTLDKWTPFVQHGINMQFNDFDNELWHGKGHTRQELLMFWADIYLSNSNGDIKKIEEDRYVGFVDSDCLFLTYVDREDLFEDGLPVVNARIGKPQGDFWQSVPSSTQWIMGGLVEPMRCMSYFPFIIKASHLKEMRSFFEDLHKKAFNEIFQEYSEHDEFSQFNVMCAYLWYYKRESYQWYISDTDPSWNLKDSYSWDEEQPLAEPPIGANTDKTIFSAEMFRPKPRVAIHSNYYSSDWRMLKREGFCRSPPFPKPAHSISIEHNIDHDMTEGTPCASVVLGSVWNEMHTFEETDFAAVADKEALEQAHRDRHERIRKCDHHAHLLDWDFWTIHPSPLISLSQQTES